ncbi:alanine--tRNA ligase [Rosistilla oblonga]|uniref:Alanine--tRNA ligase n=1 Tax=Rosistilla oblonga TaxID=2527990 RepID=A0A518J2E5_9BACT|nr:alanine--tRNA ligase [Rosistilla oblonga]QDV59502.1 Alanine--tRNA ligase [Rosistilla oblonga]
MKTDELREMYLDFYVSKGHTLQGSDVLVPTWDPSVLFTPAGMNQFKDHFLGKVKLDFTRATTCQKCLRTGDIENVGRTAYHHTFFEMLGNFSFGDYFKTEAIHWAWEFLTDKKWLNIPAGRLNVTVYKDDDEAFGIWHEQIGLPTSKIARMDEDENFWPASAPSQGPDGVCGPCSEIYYELEGGESVEIWNLVFTQFNRIGSPPDNLHPLPSKNIDTGMGLERCASVLQGQPTNYHIDNLFPIVQAAAEVCSRNYSLDSDDGRRLRRITDHVRACTFSIHENVYPGPDKAKYVVRRLIRRAVLDGHQMGLREPFLHQIVPAVVEQMKKPYPELAESVQRVTRVMQKEEEAFFQTLDAALSRIDQMFTRMEDVAGVMVDGNEAADLYKTYGVPPELLQTLASEKNLTFDWDGYNKSMDQHAVDSGAGQKELFQTGPLETLKESLRETPFLGYEQISASCHVKGIIVGNTDGDEHLLGKVAAGGADQELRVVLDHTPFYAESGGQVGDVGTIHNDDFEFHVTDTQKHAALIVHYGHLVRGTIHENATVTADVDTERRDAIRRAHSATHILHHALQKHVGQHAQQQGSKVEADVLRFDFTNQEALSETQIEAIQSDVLEHVAAGDPIRWDTVPLADARAAGAMMLFGEKYPDPVRMVSMGEFSKELCGGTHLDNTGDVQAFELTSEESVSSNTRRIVALTGEKAKAYRQQTTEILEAAAKQLACPVAAVSEATKGLIDQVRKLKKQLASGNADVQKRTPVTGGGGEASYAKMKLIVRDTARMLNVAAADVSSRIDALLADEKSLIQQLANLTAGEQVTADDLLADAETVGEALLIVRTIDGANPNVIRQLIDQLRKKSDKPVAVLLATVVGGDKVILVAGISKSLVEGGMSAGKWVGEVAAVVGGGGGGKPDLAQAGGKDPEKLPAAIDKAKEVGRSMIG